MIIDKNYQGKKFLPVWDLFESRTKQIMDTKDKGTKWQVLDELCTKLAT